MAAELAVVVTSAGDSVLMGEETSPCRSPARPGQPLRRLVAPAQVGSVAELAPELPGSGVVRLLRSSGAAPGYQVH